MDERLRNLMHLAREHYENREYDQAEPILQQIVREHQGFADMFNMLGVIQHGHGHFTQAQELFEQALVINPSYTEAALKDVSGHVVTLAKAEDLPAHGEAVRRRFER